MKDRDSLAKALQVDHAMVLLAVGKGFEPQRMAEDQSGRLQRVDESELTRHVLDVEAKLCEVQGAVAKLDAKVDRLQQTMDRMPSVVGVRGEQPTKGFNTPSITIVAARASPTVPQPPIAGATAQSVVQGFNLGSRLPVSNESLEQVARTIGVQKDTLRQESPGDWFAIAAADRPGGYYVLPNPLSARESLMSTLARFYSDTEESAFRSDYELIEPAWLPEDLLRKAAFNIHRLDATWSAVSSVGRARRRELPPS